MGQEVPAVRGHFGRRLPEVEATDNGKGTVTSPHETFTVFAYIENIRDS